MEADVEGAVRLLPWTRDDGKPCYLLGGGGGPVSRLADAMEREVLGMAAELLGHADDMLGGAGPVTPEQYRFLAARLTEALRDVSRIAESRAAGPAAPDRAAPSAAGEEEPGSP